MENKDKLQCHFISNTHWDREWRFSARRTQYMLGYMLDMLLDILDRYPDYKHFHLDSQTMPIQDYLEVYPEKKENSSLHLPKAGDVKMWQGGKKIAFLVEGVVGKICVLRKIDEIGRAHV